MKKIIVLFFILSGMLGGCSSANRMREAELIPASAFDTVFRGAPVSLYTLRNDSGMVAQITNYGARVVALWVPDRTGGFQDVVWGYPSIAGYLTSEDHFGGPIVGRYGNRIAKGAFQIDGRKYQLTINDGENHLHGGSDGLWNRVWTARPFTNPDGEQCVEMSYLSPDGEQGYPGNLAITVTYTVERSDALRIEYRATTDSVTVVNLTSHGYFNLHGNTASSTNSHLLTLCADSFTPTDAGLIPTGEIAPVAGTPLDFTQPTPIGERIDADCIPLKLSKGYDHNFILRKKAGEIALAAELYEPSTGILMKVETDQPAIQFYSGNFMTGKEVGKRNDRHDYRTGIALETQNYPDAPNHSNFPSSVLRPGEVYSHTCVYRFGVTK